MKTLRRGRQRNQGLAVGNGQTKHPRPQAWTRTCTSPTLNSRLRAEAATASSRVQSLCHDVDSSPPFKLFYILKNQHTMLLFKPLSMPQKKKKATIFALQLPLTPKTVIFRILVLADSFLLLNLIKCYFNDRLHHYKNLEILDKMKSQRKAIGSLPERLFQKYHTHRL